jgi:hypothetical protein
MKQDVRLLMGNQEYSFNCQRKETKIICFTGVQKVPENLKMVEFLLYREDKCSVVQNQLSTKSYY